MYPSTEARELAILLRISRELDICGDVTATVDNPSELIAWATILTDPRIIAWRARDSGNRYIQVSAHHERAPVRGHVSAVLGCEQHLDFWDQIHPHASGDKVHTLSLKDLTRAWEAVPIAPPDAQTSPQPPE